MNANPLLRRQLKKFFGPTAAPETDALVDLIRTALATPADADRLGHGLAGFIAAVADAYAQYERDLHLRSRSLDLSSAELHAANERLRAEIASRQDTLNALLAAANRLRAQAGLPALEAGAAEDVAAIGQMMADLLRERQAAEARLKLAARVIDSADVGITVTDAAGTIVSVNPAFSQVTGYAAAEVLGKNPRLLQSGRQDAEFYQAMWETIRSLGLNVLAEGVEADHQAEFLAREGCHAVQGYLFAKPQPAANVVRHWPHRDS